MFIVFFLNMRLISNITVFLSDLKMASTSISTEHESGGLSNEAGNESKKHSPPGSCQKLLPVDSADLMKVIINSSSMVSF